jgi:hypothetical protein
MNPWVDCGKQIADGHPELPCKRNAGHTGQCWRITPMPWLRSKIIATEEDNHHEPQAV